MTGLPTLPSAPSDTHAGRAENSLLGRSSVLTWGALGLILLAALGLRLALIDSPFGWLESDEAIVGLMARHILFDGAWPVFYWGQSYLGALESYSAAAIFAFLGPTTFALKLVPAIYSLGFIGLSYAVAARLFGPGPGLLTAAYLAVPPAMLAVWSIKPRGGYAEMLFLGQLALLLALVLPDRRHPGWWAAALGAVSGLVFWTNQLAIIYLLPIGVYLVLRMRTRLLPVGLFAGLGFCVGAAPLIVENLREGMTSAGSLTGMAGGLSDVPRNVYHLWRIGMPVIMGLAPPTADWQLWQADWPTRPAGYWAVALVGNLLLLAGLVPYRRAVWALLRGKGRPESGPALLVGVFLATVAFLPFTLLALLVAEPRYALPLYAVVPLYAALAWRLRSRLPLFLAAVLLPVALNIHSLATADPWLMMPTTAGASTPENRTELIAFLKSEGLDRIYTDYWLAYPLIFESEERILASVTTNGFNRFLPYVHLVYISERPAFVLVRERPEAEDFYAALRDAGATATVARVSIYDVVYDVEPLELVRP